MPPYHPTRAEQETVLRWDRASDQVAIRETAFSGGTHSGKTYRLALARFRWGVRGVTGRPTTGRPFPRIPRSGQEPREDASSDPSAGARRPAPLAAASAP